MAHLFGDSKWRNTLIRIFLKRLVIHFEVWQQHITGVRVNGEQQDLRVCRCAKTLNWFLVAWLLLSFGVSWGDGWGRSCGWAGINPHLSERGQNNDCRYQPLTQIPAALAPQRVKAAVIWSGWWGECLPSSTSLPASRWRLHLLSHLPTH